MRVLANNELALVAGGGEGDPLPPCHNNNGYGNGAEYGPPPGRSGTNNPQLLADNLGPLGVR
jgi:hypothetical protein